MKIVEGITLTYEKVRNVKNNLVLEIIIPNPDLGFYKSLLKLKELGYVVDCYIDSSTVKLNPKLFIYLDKTDEENALIWWNTGDWIFKYAIADKYHKEIETIKEHEIVSIWRKELDLVKSSRVEGLTSEQIFEKLELEENSVYEVEVKCSEFNLEHKAILFTGFKTGGYCKVYQNSYDYPIDMMDMFSIEVIKFLTSIK